MATCRFDNVRIAGISSAVPGPAKDVLEGANFSPAEVEKIVANTGVRRRHLAGSLCTSDLCAAAAERLFESTGISRESVGVLIFVTQSPDYVLPATACSLQHRIGLSTSCAAFDVNLGCSGYVYGLWLAAGLLQSGISRVLLLAGDTVSRMISPLDRSTALLFGDAGSATILERDTAAPPCWFELGADGGGAANLVIPAGGFRKPHSPATVIRSERENANVRSDEDIYMNGGEIFAFTLARVPALCKAVLKAAGWNTADPDAWVMHQANRFMLQHITKLLKLPAEKAIIALDEYGNTSSASIPLALSTALNERLSSNRLKLVLAGFGVGLSWAAAALECGPMPMPEVFEI